MDAVVPTPSVLKQDFSLVLRMAVACLGLFAVIGAGIVFLGAIGGVSFPDVPFFDRFNRHPITRVTPLEVRLSPIEGRAVRISRAVTPSRASARRAHQSVAAPAAPPKSHATPASGSADVPVSEQTCTDGCPTPGLVGGLLDSLLGDANGDQGAQSQPSNDDGVVSTVTEVVGSVLSGL